MLLKIGLGAAFWGIMFLAVSAVMVTPLPIIAQQLIEIIVAAVVGFILGRIYFKKNPGDMKQGVIIAVIWLLVSAVLDLLITIQYVKAGGSYVSGLKNFYGMWSLWVSFILFIVGVVLAAKFSQDGQPMKPAVKMPPLAPTPSVPEPPTQPTPPPAV